MFAYLVNWLSVGEVKANFTLNKRHVLVPIVRVDTLCTSILNVLVKYFGLKSRVKDEIVRNPFFSLKCIAVCIDKTAFSYKSCSTLNFLQKSVL
jgi:hypothetical protein